MDKGLRLLTLALVLIVLALVVYNSTAPPECPREASLAIVRVEMEHSGWRGKQRGGGSGVVISKRRVLTVCHVVDAGELTGIVAVDADGVETHYVARVVTKDPETDLALLETSSDLPESIVLGVDAAAELAEYAPIWAVGAACLESPHTRTRGEFISRRSTWDENRWVGTACVAGGHSGGAVLDCNGWLIGIITAADDTGTVFCFVPMHRIVEFLAENPEPVAEAQE